MKKSIAVVLIILAFAGGFYIARTRLSHNVTDASNKIPGSITVDVDSDGTKELVYVDSPQEVDATDGNPGNARVWYADNGIVRVVHETTAGMELRINADDWTGDGKPEIRIEEQDPNSSACIRTVYIYVWNGKGFVNLVGGQSKCIDYSAEAGGMIVQHNGNRKPVTIVTYGWDDGEPNFSAHRYFADYYVFNGRFVITKSKRTNAAYGDKAGAIEELGL